MTPKKLRDYVPGKGCLCGAWHESECSCNGVDWTPKEVYRLRNKVKLLKAQLAEARAMYQELLDAGGTIEEQILRVAK